MRAWSRQLLIVVAVVVLASSSAPRPGAGAFADPGVQGDPFERQIGRMLVSGVGGEGYGTSAGAIKIYGYEWNASFQSGTGKSLAQPFVVTKRIDKATPILLRRLTGGVHIPTVKVELTKTDSTSAGPWVYMRYCLGDVIITRLQDADLGTPSDVPVEDISFTFRRIVEEYWETRTATKVIQGHDFALNIATTTC